VPVPRSTSHNVRAVLQDRGFRRLLAVRLISQLADGWFQAGLAGSILFNPDKQTSPMGVAAGFAMLLLPYSLIGPYVGVFIDRWSRRSILFTANVLRAALALPTALLIWSESRGPAFLLLAFGIIGINRFFLSGVAAALPHVVEDRRLVTANALAGTLGSVTFSAGLGSAVLAIKTLLPATVHGYALIASFAVFGYALSATLARSSFAASALGPDAPPVEGLLAGLARSFGGMVAGLGHLASKRGAAYALLAQAAHRLLFGVLALATLLLYRNYFAHGRDIGGSISGLGAVFAAGGAGALAAAFLTPPVTRRIGGWRWIVALLGFEGVAILLCGLPFRADLLVLAVFFVNLASQGIKIVVDTDLQHECADEFRGRVFSINDTAFNALFVVGLFIGALALPDNGRSIAVLAAVAIGFPVIAAWYAVVGGRWARRVGDDIAKPAAEATTPVAA
jgi:hypothetical protein